MLLLITYCNILFVNWLEKMKLIKIALAAVGFGSVLGLIVRCAQS